MSKQVKWLLIALIVVFLILQYRLWFSQGGIVDMLTLKTQAATKSAAVTVLKNRNDKLITKVKSLKDGDVDIAEHARNDLGLVDQGEVYFQIVNPKQNTEDTHENIIEQ